MNHICVAHRSSKFIEEKHLVLLVDGDPLDVLLSREIPTIEDIEGLIPTLLDWLSDDKEQALVWDRALPPEGTRANFPVLMCPDDLDLWCTVIVVEVESSAEKVTWRRFGIDATDFQSDSRAKCGDGVKWAAGPGPFVFQRDVYEECLDVFRQEINKASA